MASIVEDKIRQWQQEQLTNYCSSCSDTCCNGRKHRICIDETSLSLFKEKGIPFIRKKDLDISSLAMPVLLSKKGHALDKPSIVEVPKGLWNSELYIYANYCPFYVDNQCQVHEDPRRPSVCRQYPLLFLGALNYEASKMTVAVMDSCEYFRKPQVRRELTDKFPVAILNDGRD